LSQELADPVIQQQQLRFLRAAAYAYGNWFSNGLRLHAADELLRTARERMDFLNDQVQSGLLPRIVLTDNQRLVVTRELGVVQAQRRFEAASLVLSLFHRDSEDRPILNPKRRLPERVALGTHPELPSVEQHIARALVERPEIRSTKLSLELLNVDQRLARNQRLPNLDATVVGRQPLGSSNYRDKEQTEVLGGLALNFPLQQREARGRIGELDARAEQWQREFQFLNDQIVTEIYDAHSAWVAAYGQLQQADINLQLARTLQEAELSRFEGGASDLLSLQLREQATLEALLLVADAQNEGVRAYADYLAATALVYFP
jgi:outer membrane protein TolC